jgi:uncharacterized Tic20 family protein
MTIKGNILEGATILTTLGLKEWITFLHDNRAQAGTVMTLVSAAITVLIGVLIYANVKNSMPAVNDSVANATITSMSATVYSAIGLVCVGFIVMAAVFILNVVRGMGD